MEMADIYWALPASLECFSHFFLFLTLIPHFHFTVEDSESQEGRELAQGH